MEFGFCSCRINELLHVVQNCITVYRQLRYVCVVETRLQNLQSVERMKNTKKDVTANQNHQ
jgi:hypothetical protein